VILCEILQALDSLAHVIVDAGVGSGGGGCHVLILSKNFLNEMFI
jgi:threonine dehydratase